MVFFKVTDGIQTRKFQATLGKFTYSELKNKLASLFPEAVKENSNLVLRYQDMDGDFITLSSDQELQEALSSVPDDKVLKFYLPNPLKNKRENRETSQARSSSLLHHLLAPSLGCSSGSLADLLEKETKEFVDLLHSIHNPTPSTSDTASHKESTEGNADSRDTTSSDAETTGDEPKKEGQVGDEEEVKSKPCPASSSTASETQDGHAHCHIKCVGGLGPSFLGDSLLGPVGAGWLGRPVAGYRISWSPCHHTSHGCSCSKTPQTQTAATV